MKIPTTNPRAALRPGSPPYRRESGAPTKGLQELGGSLSGSGRKLAADFAKRRDEDERTALLDLSQQGEAMAQALFQGAGEKKGLADLEYDAAMSGITDYEANLDKELAGLYERAPGHLQPKLKVALDRVRTVYALKGQQHAGRERVRYKAAIRQAQANKGVASMAENAHTETGIELGLDAIRVAVEDLPEEIREGVFAEYAGIGYEDAINRLITDSDEIPGSLEDARKYFDRDDVQGLLGKRAKRVGDALEAAELGAKGEASALEILSHEDADDDYGRIDEGKALQRLNALPPKERPHAKKAIDEHIAQREAAVGKLAKDAEDDWFRIVTSNGYRDAPSLRPFEQKLRALDPVRLAEMQRWLTIESKRRHGQNTKNPTRRLAAAKAVDAMEAKYVAMMQRAEIDPEYAKKIDIEKELNMVLEPTDRRRISAAKRLAALKNRDAWERNAGARREVRETLKNSGRLPGKDKTEDDLIVQRTLDHVDAWAEEQPAPPTEKETLAQIDRAFDKGYISSDNETNLTLKNLMLTTTPVGMAATAVGSLFGYDLVGPSVEDPSITRMEAAEQGKTFYSAHYLARDTQKILDEQIAMQNRKRKGTGTPLIDPTDEDSRRRAYEKLVAAGVIARP